MSSNIDDPFTTPKLSARFANLDPPSPLLDLPNSPTQIKRTLEAHLLEVNRRIDGAAELGRTLLGQQQDLESRIRDVEDGGEQLDPELKKKLADLEKEYNQVGRDSARAVLTNKIMAGSTGNGGSGSPFGAGNLPGSPSTFQSNGSSSPSKLTVPSRRQRNQPSRQHDLEFAAELGQGLLVEVRRLQALLSEREEALKIVQIEKSRLEEHAEGLESRIRSLDESEQRFKEENWNLELMIQELHALQSEQKETESKLQTQIALMEHEKNIIIKELDEWKQQHGRLCDELESDQKHHEVELASLRRSLTINESDRTALERKVEELKQDLDESHKASMRLRQLENRSDADDKMNLFEITLPANETPEHSPPTSPTKATPRHGALEAETLKSSLHHAHRVITNLKSNIHREKTEKAELKRLLQDARDELETARNGLTVPPGSTGKRRKPDGSYGGAHGAWKKSASRFNLNLNLLGGARKSKDEVSVLEPPVDDEWEEAEDDILRSTTYGVLRAYAPNVPRTADYEGESAFETAFETNDRRSSDVFETANEQDSTATETEAYRTGNESPIKDYPTSADDLTETEGSVGKTLKKKASHLSAISNISASGSPLGKSIGKHHRRTSSGVRPLRSGKPRHRNNSYVSTASTEDDDEDRIHRYTTPDIDGDDNNSKTLEDEMGTNNPRLKLRINRARSRGGRSRMNSDSSLFRPFSAGSSIDGSQNESPNKSAISSQSLFAELGDGTMLESEEDDDEDLVEEEEEEEGEVAPMVEMVDSGCMTEEPYPDVSLLSAEKPATAAQLPLPVPVPELVKQAPVMVEIGTQSDAEPEPKKIATSDIGTQSLERIKTVVSEVGTQSDETKVAVSEIGTQSEVSVGEIGTQSDEIKIAVSEFGTQSDDIEVAAVSEIGTQSDNTVVAVNEIGTQSDVVQLPEAVDMATQFDPELEESHTHFVPISAPLFFEETKEEEEESVPAKETTDSSTQFDPELEKDEEKATPALVPVVAPEIKIPSIAVKDTTNSSTQFDPEIETLETEVVALAVQSVQTEPEVEKQSNPVVVGTTQTMHEEENEKDIILGKEKEVASQMIKVPLVFSEINSQNTEPIEPPSTKTPLNAVPVPVAMVDSSISSDEDTPKKVSERVEDLRQRPVTPTPAAEKAGFFGSVFGTFRRRDLQSESEIAASKGERLPFSEVSSNVVKKDGASAPLQMSDQTVQTEMSYTFFENLSNTTEKGGKPSIFVVGTSDNGLSEKVGMDSPSILSRNSLESIGRSRTVKSGNFSSPSPASTITPGSLTKRPGSPSSMKDYRTPSQLAQNSQQSLSAQLKAANPQETGGMGPPALPASHTQKNVAFRPRTPVQDRLLRDPETPASRGGITPRVPRFSATRSEVSSPTSRRSSISSFTSELEDRFKAPVSGSPMPDNAQTDPRMIQAITQTMIGEYLWKYTRNAGRGTISQNRHKRFFWVHPYTRTLYWSDRDPASAGRSELRTKSVAIEAVKVVTDDNPMPPGLHRKSLVVVTPGRALKFTAPTGQRHETWFNALSYLLLRTGGELEEGAEQGTLTTEDIRDFNPDFRGAPSLSSFNSRNTRSSSPTRNASALSNRRPDPRPQQGSMSRLSSIFRPNSAFGTFSSRSSRHNPSIYDASEVNDSAEDLRLEIEREEREQDRLENVRACCDGKHDVGTLTRRGGRRGGHSHRGRQHEHHHHAGHERNHSHS